jgi:hypothetical protein
MDQVVADRFVAHENVRRFKKQLESCTDERQRDMLKQLLAAEETKLQALALGRQIPLGH